MPRWTSYYIDTRAIKNKGQMGLYKCERCGKLHWYKMCARKRTKHVFCSTKCKKDSQVNYNREKIDDKLYKKIYDENYKLVQACAFQICENKIERLQYFEDCMQYGFIELWKTYNRNKMDCSKKYLRKAIKNTMIDGIKWWFDSNKKYILMENLQIIDIINRK